MPHKVILHGSSQRLHAQALIMKAPQDAVVTVYPPKRTLDQNDKMWAMLSDVSISKPEGREHTPEVWKQLFMNACGHECQFELGLNGKPFPVGFRSSRLSKSQMADLITFIYQYGDEHGVKWNEAEEKQEKVA